MLYLFRGSVKEMRVLITFLLVFGLSGCTDDYYLTTHTVLERGRVTEKYIDNSQPPFPHPQVNDTAYMIKIVSGKEDRLIEVDSRTWGKLKIGDFYIMDDTDIPHDPMF
jgi:hypothetical protein